MEPADQNLINIGEAQYIRVMPTRFGRFDLQADADGYYRDSDQDVLGRDVGRIGAALTWTRGTVLPYGVALDGTAQLRLDAFSVRRDPSYAPHFTQATPAAAVALRWPLVRTGDGFAETLEPVAQLVWSDVSGDEAPNEDSRVVDFDEGNLFSLDRYPGRDLSETGTRLNLGISYTRLESDWQLNGYIGRIYRFDDEYQFSEPTGLAGQWSDWLVSAQLGLGDAFLVTNRAVFDNSFDVARNELRLALEAGSAEFATSYLWLVADTEESLDDDVHEAVFTAGYEFNRHWLGAIESRWDILDETISRTDFDLTYRNECIAVDLSVSRRYENSNYIEPTYDFGLEISLQGFGSNDSSRYARSCPG